MDKEIPNCLVDKLTTYEKVEYVEQAFSDSTHHLWRLHKSNSDQKNHFLKVCSNTRSPFWRIMYDLFDYELCNEITRFSDTYSFIDQICSLGVPKLIKVEQGNNDELRHDSFILTSELKGSAVNSIGVNAKSAKQQIKQIAKHLAELHSNPINTWGSLNSPTFNSSDWSIRLLEVLSGYEKKRGGVILDSVITIKLDRFMKQILDDLPKIKPTQFVPIMPDLRWDQFLHIDGVITALVDLDAFVYAPYEVDFVILEYLLLPEQLETFSVEYSKYNEIPNINLERNAYRLLLFHMQILGEEDLDVWMNKERMF